MVIAETSNIYTDEGMVSTTWESQEGARLRSMDEFLASITEEDLRPVIKRARESRPWGVIDLIDIGAGTGNATENLCEEEGVIYYAYDAKREFLDARSTNPVRTIKGKSENMAVVPNRRFAVAVSRAATAWSGDQEKSVAEQLRVAEYAVFTEYDWRHASIHCDDRNVVAAGWAAKMTIMSVLEAAKFDTMLGSKLGHLIDEVATRQSMKIERQEVRHELPIADHRAIFLGAATTILEQLKAARNSPNSNPIAAAKAATAVPFLEKYLTIISTAKPNSVAIRLPALVTQIVKVVERP